MTKADIVNEITKNTGIDKTTVLTTVEAFMDAVKASLSKDENVYLRGFGSFVLGEPLDPQVPGFRADLQEQPHDAPDGRRQGRFGLQPERQVGQ